jgi:hypothetical protein
MKKLLLSILLSTGAAVASETITSEMYCDDTKTLVKQLRETYQEEPFLIGKAGDEAGSIMTLWLNPLTKSWTILATKDTLTCVVGLGNKIELVPRQKSKTL